jgi:hypothetical protein
MINMLGLVKRGSAKILQASTSETACALLRGERRERYSQ